MSWIAHEVRDFSADEHEFLESLLEGDAAGAQQLRAQLPFARNGGVDQPGCQCFDIIVDAGASPALGVENPYRPDLVVVDGDELIGWFLVWHSEGVLASIEYCWVVDEEPNRLPRPDELISYDEAASRGIVSR